MNFYRALMPSLVLLMATACGDDDASPDALSGVFEVSSHTLDTSGCDALQPFNEYELDRSEYDYITYSDFFSLSTRTEFGATVKALMDCPSADACPSSNRDDDFSDSRVFTERRGNGWVSTIVRSGYRRSRLEAGEEAVSVFNCEVQHTETIIEPTDTGIRISQRVGEMFPDVEDADACYTIADNPPVDQLNCIVAEEVFAEPVVTE